MIAISLPSGTGFGWGIAGTMLRVEFAQSGYIDLSQEQLPKTTHLPMLHASQGVNMMPLNQNVWSTRKNVSYSFIEDSELLKKYAANAGRYFDANITGSSWCSEIFREAGIKNVSTAIQGVDTNTFRPGAPTNPDRFTIFTGGKVEFRKGTDIAMKAIGVLQQRHDDVYAVASYYNPWPASVATMSRSKLLPWRGSVREAMIDAGMDLARITGPVDQQFPHERMSELYHQCDVGLFPNRCEGGNNMVCCEFMACAKPVVAMSQHGHRDVIDVRSIYTIDDCRDIVDTNGVYWEPNFDEVVFNLEYAYENRDEDAFAMDGGRNRERMLELTWRSCADSMLEVLHA